jgi:hypothetical protein
MGASVYAFIEYRMYDDYWSFGEIELFRDVEFLCAIAWGDGGITDEMPYPPRDSFPADASRQARESFFVSADDVRKYLEGSRILEFSGLDDEAGTSLEKYARLHGDWAVNEYETSGLLPQPELTHTGWLNLAELEANLAHRRLEPVSLSPAVRAALAAMAELAAVYGKEGVRLVFWIGL